MEPRELRDVLFGPPTVFTSDGSEIDHEAYQRVVRHIEDSGGSVFLACSNTGEYYALGDDERVAAVRSTARALEDGVVVAGAAGSLAHVTELADRYEDAGADALMLMHPDHTYVHEEGLRRYYEHIDESTDLELVLYKRGPELTDELLDTLSQRDGVVGVKYAVNDIDAFARAVSNTNGDIAWICGLAERFAPSFAMEGADGYTTAVGAVVPDVALSLTDALEAGDWERAREIRDAVRPFEEFRDESGENNRFESANNVPAVKYGLEFRGFTGGPVRPPLAELSDDDKGRVEARVQRLVER